MNTMEQLELYLFFKNDIEKQIKKLDKIFPDIKIKNKFIVVKSFNTVIGNEPHKDWVDTFTKLKKKLMPKFLRIIHQGCGF